MLTVAEEPALASGLGERLKALREAAKLTQQELATRARLSVSIVAQIEQGRTPDPRIRTLLKLSRVLGCSIDDLVGPAD